MSATETDAECGRSLGCSEGRNGDGMVVFASENIYIFGIASVVRERSTLRGGREELH